MIFEKVGFGYVGRLAAARAAAQAYKAFERKYAAAMEAQQQAQAPEAEDVDPIKNRDFRQVQVAQAPCPMP
ncbi:MAG: hypothetical protein Kow002_21400 [Anaerolineales bacterium]